MKQHKREFRGIEEIVGAAAETFWVPLRKIMVFLWFLGGNSSFFALHWGKFPPEPQNILCFLPPENFLNCPKNFLNFLFWDFERQKTIALMYEYEVGRVDGPRRAARLKKADFEPCGTKTFKACISVSIWSLTKILVSKNIYCARTPRWACF